MSKWYRLDNAAKIFSPAKSKNDPKIFRFSCTLKEKIKPYQLKQALDLTLNEYPIFKSTLKSGFFWHYLEESTIEPKVIKESAVPCSEFKNGLLFEVSYYNNRINLEVNHTLTDGTGTLTFLKSLIANYLNLIYNIQCDEFISSGSAKELKEDSFRKYKTKNFKKALKVNKLAYKIHDEKYLENSLKIIEGHISVQKLLQIAKTFDTTITVYLTSVLIKAIGDTREAKEQNKPIVIAIPVNLRNYYPSYTVRNFFNAVSISYDYHNQDLEEIVKEVKNKFALNLDKENVQNKMNNMAALEDIFILRLIPNFIKNIILKIAYRLTNKYQTMTLSNIGIIKMPQVYEDYIDYFNVFISTSTIQLCVCSFKDKLVLSFSSQYINSEIEKSFFKTLSQGGILIDIYTNDGGNA